MKRLLAIAFLVTACSGSSGGVGAGSVPAATEVTLSTAAPWPAAYEDKVCSALVQLEGAGDDLVELAAAAEELDVERVSLMAYAAGGYFLGVQTTLIDTPSWTPGDLLVKRLREIAAEGIAATELIDQGASDVDAAKLEKGAARLQRATNLIDSATIALAGLERNRGFSC